MISQIDLCNNALDLVGQGMHIDTLEDDTKEADLCRRNYSVTVQRALAKFNFNFARKDEVITDSNLLDTVSLPWAYTYSLPEDCQRVLFLNELDDTSEAEQIHKDEIRFNFRQVDKKAVLVTDHKAPFVVQYQSYVYDTELFSDGFAEAVEFLLASRMATALIHGLTGLQIGQQLLQTGNLYLNLAASADAQQGVNSIIPTQAPKFIRARKGLV